MLDVDNGARFETYMIEGERGSGEMNVNGAAARLVHTRRPVIVVSYGAYEEQSSRRYEPTRRPRRRGQRNHRRGRRRRDPSGAQPVDRSTALRAHCTPRPARRAPAGHAPALAEKKGLGEPIVMVTAYDYPSAQVAEEAGVDVVLVGDSGAMTVLGYPRTVPVTIDEMLMLARPCAAGCTTPLLVGDLPFGSYEASDEQAVATASGSSRRRAATRSRSSAAAARSSARAAIVAAGIPVMGHVGLTPQSATALGGYRSQGRTAERGGRGGRRRARAPGGGLLRDRVRGGPGAVTETMHGAHGHPGDRHRRRPGDRRPGARVPRPARHLRRPRAALHEALRRDPRTR